MISGRLTFVILMTANHLRAAWILLRLRRGVGIILGLQRILSIFLTEVQKVAVTNLHLHLRQDVGELWII